MEDAPNDKPRKILYQIFIEICVAFRNNAVLFWTVFIWGILQCLIGALLPLTLPWKPDSSQIKNTAIAWFLQNAPTILAYGICLILLTALANVASHLKVGFSDKELKRRYLRRMVREKEQFGITGLPPDFAIQSMQLDDIVIPLEFRLDEPLTDYPLTKDELRYYGDRRSKGTISQEESRLLNSSSQSWLRPLNQNRITIADLWKRLTQKEPVAVIHGFPGMGKSTLLTYLLLYMARCNLRRLYKHRSKPKLRPKLIPIYIHLGDYARACDETPNNILSLRTYLAHTLEDFNIDRITQFIINDCLRTGRCLVLLDGLEKVESQDIQRAIVAFIREYSDTYENTRRFNRFLITSRVAPHSRTHFLITEGFSEYPCYTIAELTAEQKEVFWPIWFLANTSHDRISSINHLFGRERAITEEASRSARDFYIANKDQIKDLAGRPLLLALLAVMQYNQQFHKQPIELYSNIIYIMLEGRKNAEGNPVFSEVDVNQVLGPLAFTMQEKGERILRKSEVIESFKESLHDEGQAKDFLNRLSFQRGFFVQRAGDYYGFFHVALQKYITACYIFHKMKRGNDSETSELINKIYMSDNLREPLFLAVKYNISENSIVAKKIIQSLLTMPHPPQPAFRSSGYQVLLAARCLVEAEALITDPNHNDPNLDKSIAKHLLEVYEDAQKQQLTALSKEVEEIITLWIKNLPSEVPHTYPLLSVVCEAMRDTNHPMRQRAMLTLLSANEEHLLSCACASTILNEFIPLLLTLAGLPSIGRYDPATDLTETIDSGVAKLAQSILLCMGRQESTGLSLTEMNQHFASQSIVPSASSGSAQ